MTSYITLLSKIEAFCNAHLQIKKYKGEFREQMPNFSTEDEKYPVVFVSPTSDVEDMNTNQFTVDIYCVDIIQKDRANLNTALSDCHLILKDLYTYYKDDGDLQIDVVGTANLTPLNNFDLDYVSGWVMSITFEVGGYGKCAIPMNPIAPFEPLCEDATYSITDSDLNELYSGTIVSGGTLSQEIQDSTYLVEYVNGTPIESGSILAEGSVVVQVPDPIVCEDATYEIKDTDLNVLYSGSIPSGGNLDQIITDSTAVLKNTLNTTLSTTSILAEGSEDIVAPDASIHLKKENDGTIANVTIPSGVNDIYIVDNNDISVNGVLEFDIHATEALDIRLRDQSNNVVTPISVTDSGNHATIVLADAVIPTPVGATLMKTGQTTSYRTGDDGDIEAGRATSFTVLATANPFGNTNRFTDELGGQTYTNNIVIDWSTYQGNTVLGYKRTATNIVSGGWNNAIDTCAATSIGTFTSGWRLANDNEWKNIMNRGVSNPLNYAPFTTFTFTFSSHTSTTYAPASAAYSWGISSVGSIFPKDKNETSSCLVVRTFTVTGTTLS